MASYITLTTTRTTMPDIQAVLAAVKTATGDAGAVLDYNLNGTWRGKKATTWTTQQIADAQNIVDTTAAVTSQITAQRCVDQMSIYDKAQNLAIIDALNVIRSALSPPKVDITPAQAIAAIRTKAGILLNGS